MADDATDGLSPSVRRMVAEHDIDVAKLTGTGKGSRHQGRRGCLHQNWARPRGCADCCRPVAAAPVANLAGRTDKRVPGPVCTCASVSPSVCWRPEHHRHADYAFSRINMAPIMKLLRKRYGEIFEKKHGIKLGFMSAT